MMTSSLHILVAEDSLMHQRFAVRLLEQQGHRVTLVNNGLAAVRAVREGHFDLVLMDVEMPEMDGLSATQLIRAEERPGEHLPVVAVTATGDRQACLAAGMDDWLPKPLSPPRLSWRWKSCWARRRLDAVGRALLPDQRRPGVAVLLRSPPTVQETFVRLGVASRLCVYRAAG